MNKDISKQRHLVKLCKVKDVLVFLNDLFEGIQRRWTFTAGGPLPSLVAEFPEAFLQTAELS